MDIGGDGELVEIIEIDAEQPSNLNIGDVIEAISAADPEAAVALEAMAAPPAARAPEPYVRIVEQPASKALRFRYECEGRSAGSIPGVNSTSEHKTYPTIEVVGFSGKAIVVVSCVTRDEPPRPHPHNLVGRERCRNGVCTLRHDFGESPRVSFTNLGIQCVKRRDIAEALTLREAQKVDPFRTGFAHKTQPQSIDLNAVRLCFQVFLLNDANRVQMALRPEVSDVIYDKKAMSDLQILRISRPSGPITGGTEVILLCEKVTREDISVVVCEESPAGIVWEESGNIIIVHKQVAIAFTTPPYKDTVTPKHVNVSIQLKRVSDGARSNSVQFQYIPEYQDSEYLKRKRQKPNPLGLLERIDQLQKAGGFMAQGDVAIKTEPSGGSPLHRYTPADQPEMYQQQPWGGEVMAGSSQYYGQQPQSQQGWPQPAFGHNLPQPMQMSQQSRSPLQQAVSPGLHTMAPMQQTALHTMPPMQQQLSPMHQQAMSPQGMHQQAVSPMHQQAMSPMHQQAMSPMHQQGMSPIHQQNQRMSPLLQQSQPMLHQQPNQQGMQNNQQNMSPLHQQNQQRMSPLLQQSQQMSLHQQGMQNNQQNMSPLHQQDMRMSPMHQQSNQMKMSPILQCNEGLQGMSPMQQAGSPLPPAGACASPHLMDTDRVGVAPVMGQMTNVGMPNMVTQGQEMESSSSLSLNNLLNMDAGGPIQLNSGDLSNLSALLGQYRSNELSDSLNRLSTTDLLDPTVEQH